MTSLLSCGPAHVAPYILPNDSTKMNDFNDKNISVWRNDIKQCSRTDNHYGMPISPQDNNNIVYPYENGDGTDSFETVQFPRTQCENINTTQGSEHADLNSINIVMVQSPIISSEEILVKGSESDSSEEDRDYPALPTVSLSPVPGPLPKCSFDELYFPEQARFSILSPSWSRGYQKIKSPKYSKTEKVESLKIPMTITKAEENSRTDHEKEDWLGWGNNPEWRMSPKQPMHNSLEDLFKDVRTRGVKKVPLPRSSYENNEPGRRGSRPPESSSNGNPAIQVATRKVQNSCVESSKKSPVSSGYTSHIFQPSFYQHVERLKHVPNGSRCDMCGKEYKRMNDLKKHMIAKHPEFYLSTSKQMTNSQSSRKQQNSSTAFLQQSNSQNSWQMSSYQKTIQNAVNNRLSSQVTSNQHQRSDPVDTHQIHNNQDIVQQSCAILLGSQQPQMITFQQSTSLPLSYQDKDYQVSVDHSVHAQGFDSHQQLVLQQTDSQYMDCQQTTAQSNDFQNQGSQISSGQQLISQMVSSEQVQVNGQLLNSQMVGQMNMSDMSNSQNTMQNTACDDQLNSQMLALQQQTNGEGNENQHLNVQMLTDTNHHNEYQMSSGQLYHINAQSGS